MRSRRVSSLLALLLLLNGIAPVGAVAPKTSARGGRQIGRARQTGDDQSEELSCSGDAEDDIVERVKRRMTDLIQVVRRVSDKLKPESNMLVKMWHGRHVGDAQKEILGLEADLACLGNKAPRFLDTVVTNVSKEDYVIPASAYPIMVEIWDHQDLIEKVVRPNTFVGEAGLPLAPTSGFKAETLTLSHNSHHLQTVEPSETEGAVVDVEYSVSQSPAAACETKEFRNDSLNCTWFNVTVRCVKAEGLPKLELIGKIDPFCKVRLKPTPSVPSTKFKSAFVKNKQMPTFTNSTFDFHFEVPLIPSHPTQLQELVPWALDHMTIQEQLNEIMYSVATNIFEHTCKDGKKCKLVNWLARVGTDSKALKQMVQAMKDEASEESSPAVQATTRRVAASLEATIDRTGDVQHQSASQAGGVSDALLEAQCETGVGSPAAMAGIRVARRQGGGGGRGRGGQGGDSVGSPPPDFVLFLVIMIGLVVLR